MKKDEGVSKREDKIEGLRKEEHGPTRKKKNLVSGDSLL